MWYHVKSLGHDTSVTQHNKVSFDLPVATIHRRDMTENLLKAMLNRTNKQQQHKGCAHYTGHSRHTNHTLRFDPHI